MSPRKQRVVHRSGFETTKACRSKMERGWLLEDWPGESEGKAVGQQ